MQPHEPSSPPPIPPDLPTPGAPHIKALLVTLTLPFVADFFLWSAIPGLSWGAFIASVGIAIALMRGRAVWNTRWGLLFAALILTAVQSAVEISFSNIFISLALLVILVGEAAYRGLAPGWERISEALWAIVKAPGRWLWVDGIVRHSAAMKRAKLDTFARGMVIFVPVLVLSVAFLILLGNGNAILGHWLSKSLASIQSWLEHIDLTFPHLFFFGLIATFCLWALHPSEARGKKRFWTRTVPEFSMEDRSTAWWRSVLILAAMNVIFFFANTIDVVYLWVGGGAMPEGVTVSQYVHEGVHSLMVAVFLSAAVLVGIFQQGKGLRGDRRLKQLGILWVVQNGLMSAGVIVRLLRYVSAYHLTAPRIYAIAFVLLVIAGFALLTLYIIKERSLNWLLLSNATATLLLLFVMQFLNVAGWVADYNVKQWVASPKKGIDLGYLHSLGAPGWEALLQVSGSKRPERVEAEMLLREIRKCEERQLANRNWRSLQLRHERVAAHIFGLRHGQQ